MQPLQGAIPKKKGRNAAEREQDKNMHPPPTKRI